MQMKVLGLSGGADSVYLFYELLKEGNFRCVYVNHKMNIHDDAAERFCRELCASHAIQLKVIDVNKPLKNETQAREARYTAFKEDVKDDILILAHHVDDVVETMLMNLCKGSSLNGMSGIASSGQVYDITFERPLIELGLNRNDIQMSLIDRQLHWYEDGTNQDNSILRNRVRNELIPLMRDMFPNCVEKIVDFGNDCRFAINIVQLHVRKRVNRTLTSQKNVNGLNAQRVWFFDWMRSEGIMVSKRHYREFVSFIGNDSYHEMSLPNENSIVKEKHTTGYFIVTCKKRIA